MTTGPVVLQAIWDSASKYSSPASKLNFSRSPVCVPHIVTPAKKEQVRTGASWKCPIKNLPVELLSLGLFSLSKAIAWKYFHFTETFWGGMVGEAINIINIWGKADFPFPYAHPFLRLQSA